MVRWWGIWSKMSLGSNYDWFHTDKALGNFWKSDNDKNKNKKKNNVCSSWGPVSGPKIATRCSRTSTKEKLLLYETKQVSVKKLFEADWTDFAAASLMGKDILTASEILGRCFLMLGPTAWARRPMARNAALTDDFSRAFNALSRYDIVSSR